MTAIPAVFLRCDGCLVFLDTDTIPDAPTIKDARLEARRKDWRITSRKDLCPDCAAETAEPHDA
jgi:hypothetical protein